MAFWTLYKREINDYFNSAVAYVVLFGSSIVKGVQFWFILTAVMGPPVYKEQSVLQIFFNWPLFWLLVLV